MKRGETSVKPLTQKMYTKPRIHLRIETPITKYSGPNTQTQSQIDIPETNDSSGVCPMIQNNGGTSSEDVLSGTGGGGGVQQVMKKGTWTATEDAILIEYVRKHGEGSWNAVQKYSGLWRCGKSCRLRWANHLRPNLKKGSISHEEERVILELHATIGNKWARMASQLPGRTDNEIKNYWNTRMKRRQRAGLPIYPQDLQKEGAAFPQQQQQLNSSSSQLSSFLSSTQQPMPDHNPTLPLFDPINFSTTANTLQNHHNSSFLPNPNHHQFKHFRDNSNGGFSGPLSPVSQYPSSPALFNQSLPIKFLPPHSLQFNSENFDISPLPPPILGASFESFGFVPGIKTELPSNQTRILRTASTTPASSVTSGDYMMAVQSNAHDFNIASPLSRGNSGLLDALLEESQALFRNDNLKGDDLSASDKGKCAMDGFAVDAAAREGSVHVTTPENQWDDSSYTPSSIGMKRKKEPLEEMNYMDDDDLLFSLLENFPSNMPVPEWYRGNGNVWSVWSDQSSNMKDDNASFDVQQEASPSPAATTSSDHDWTLSSCYWDNMPSIC